MIDENLKNRIILGLIIFTAIFFIGMVGSCSTAHRLKVGRDKEMATRLDLEEKVNGFTQEKSALENKTNSLTQELEKEKAADEETKKALLQEQLVNQSLQEEIKKLTKLKETLEEDLKEALTSAKTKK